MNKSSAFIIVIALFGCGQDKPTTEYYSLVDNTINMSISILESDKFETPIDERAVVAEKELNNKEISTIKPVIRDIDFKVDGAKGCVPYYGIIIDGISGDNTLRIYLCLSCNMYIAVKNGNKLRSGDFDLVANKLKIIIANHFPNVKNMKEL